MTLDLAVVVVPTTLNDPEDPYTVALRPLSVEVELPQALEDPAAAAERMRPVVLGHVVEVRNAHGPDGELGAEDLAASDAWVLDVFGHLLTASKGGTSWR